MTARLVIAGAALSGAVLAGAPPAGSAPGDLDQTFGTNGVAQVSTPGVRDGATALTVQADGGLVVVGHTNAGPTADGLAVRLRADGTPDASFTSGAMPGPNGWAEAATAVALMPDGRIVVAGNSNRLGGEGIVWRLLPDGRPDPTFGDGSGYVMVDTEGSAYLRDVAVAPDGRIVTAGYTVNGSSTQALVHRVTVSGADDPSFGPDGRRQWTSGTEAEAVAVQSDGKVLVTGLLTRERQVLVDRLLDTGTPDPTYGGGDGTAATGLPGFGADLALDAGGRAVVAGTVDRVGGSDAGLVRLTPSGDVDASFGSSTGASVDLATLDSFREVAVRPDGGVVALGATGGSTFVAHLRPDGLLDRSYATGGVRLVPLKALASLGLGVQPSGAVVLGGETDDAMPDVVAYRLSGPPTPSGPQGEPTSDPTVQRCHGRPATLVGTAGDDRLRGTRAVDVVVALGGSDRIAGLGGNDFVCAGDGDDRVVGGPGKDRLYGEAGKDRLVGGAGEDRLVGGPGKDRSVP